MSNLVYFDFHPSYYKDEDFRTGIIGTSDKNRFIPFYSLFAHNLFIFTKDEGDIKVLEYILPNEAPNHTYNRRYADLVYQLDRGSVPSRCIFRQGGQEHFVSSHRGIIYANNEPLLCLGINSEYVLNNSMSSLSTNLDNRKLTLFISNDFYDNPLYKNMLKKIDELYIQKFKNEKIDIVVTSNMKEWLFNNNYEKPKFKSVTAMNKHLKEVPAVLIKD